MAPHVTIPNCPECDTYEKCVADLDHHHWHCFACGSSGTIDLVMRTTSVRTTKVDGSSYQWPAAPTGPPSGPSLERHNHPT